MRTDAELGDHARIIQDDVAAAIPADDARARDRLRQVLVRRADDDLVDARRILEARRARRQRVVGLELHHGPDHHAERGNSPLRERELSQKVRVDAGARLVAGEQVVAERLDDVVEGAGDVRHAGHRDQHEEAPQQTDRGAHLTAAWARARRGAEVAAKQLVGAVHQMDLQVRQPLLGRSGGPSG